MANITFEGVQGTRESLENNNTKKSESNSTYDVRNYLDVRLKKDQDKKEIRIRLLPIDAQSSTPFKIVYMHNVKVPTEISESGWKNYLCLHRNDEIDHEKFGNKCPICDFNYQAYKNSQAEGITEAEKKAWTEASLAARPKPVCIVRCIERGKEDEGPKFYKINIREKQKDDAYNQMLTLMDTRNNESMEDSGEPYNIFDLYSGKDLKLTITAVYKDNKWTNQTNVNVVDYGKEKPLSEDEEQMNQWINDPKKWSDVFVTKPYEYLAVILDGKVPFFDKKIGKWVSKDEYFANKEENTSTTEIDQQISEAEEALNDVPETNNNGTGDLPF